MAAFRDYLRDTFENDFADYTAENELEELVEQITDVGASCEVDVTRERALIKERLSNRDEPPEDDDQAVHQGETNAEPTAHETQEAEIHRLTRKPT
jgi:hypothetical protein